MADITKCPGDGCAARESCYRALAESSERRQAWFADLPGENDKCEFYWPVRSTSELRRLNFQLQE